MDKNDTSLLKLERAADDLRRGVPAVVTDGARALVLLPAELANTPALARFDGLAPDSFLMLTNNRAATLKVAGEDWTVVRLKRPAWMTAADIVAVADPTLDLASPMKGPFERLNHPDTDLDRAAVKLVKWARLLPAVIAAEVADGAALAANEGLMMVEADTVLAADMTQAVALRQVASARVPLAGAENTRLVSFRPLVGGIEHIAIVIGDPNRHEPVLMRIHSECFTGDLLGSLKCDCGEQLRGAIKAIEKAGGGVLLYLAQEGRGIGLISKLKAYSLQDQGYDTVDANTRLGFDVDERIFAPAAEMLKALGFRAVRLMTNNPAKVEGLSRFGIEVTERVPHAFPTNPHNEGYLATKKSRTGHLL
ncbi:GTP cyclohydrolase II [Kordiimonas marina]|uniref:GTP cyclohydrolase II n=1 Tax=Kordiimonas marina TaxID=2872312 RepID=UPI001FF29717|nr:GTP cyclohydrolase II [Kordiimonas marina]MCJ9429835.1 GTP cyclohydrolase II [Kordiimonas marina]